MITKKVIFVGSKKLGIGVLKTLYDIKPESLCAIITIDDSKDSRCVLDTFVEFAYKTEKPLRILSKGSELKSAIKEFSPQLCIVAGWYWIIKPDLLKMVPEGWIGIHASVLPKYRGGAPLVWAIMNGEEETGISMFYFDEGTDTGDIIAQLKVKIGYEDNIRDVIKKVEKVAVKIIKQNYPLLLQGKASRMTQNHSDEIPFPLRTPDDGKIDWSSTDIKLYNFIRAQTKPYPCAFSFLLGSKIKIVSMLYPNKINEYHSQYTNGEIVLHNSIFYVKASNNLVQINLIDVDGIQQNFNDYCHRNNLVGNFFDKN